MTTVLSFGQRYIERYYGRGLARPTATGKRRPTERSGTSDGARPGPPPASVTAAPGSDRFEQR